MPVTVLFGRPSSDCQTLTSQSEFAAVAMVEDARSEASSRDRAVTDAQLSEARTDNQETARAPRQRRRRAFRRELLPPFQQRAVEAVDRIGLRQSDTGDVLVGFGTLPLLAVV